MTRSILQARFSGLRNSATDTSAAGAYLCQSTCVLPSLDLAPAALAARQFSTVGAMTGRVFGPTSLVSAASLAILAYLSRKAPNAFPPSSTPGTYGGVQEWQLFAASAVVHLLIVPLTAFSGVPIYRKMNVLASKAESHVTRTNSNEELLTARDKKDVRDLVREWTSFNWARCAFPILAAVLSTWACVR